MYQNPQLAEALFPKLDSMAAAAAQPLTVRGNAAGFVFGSKVVPSQTGAALDGASGADQPAVDAQGDAYLWRSLVLATCGDTCSVGHRLKANADSITGTDDAACCNANICVCPHGVATVAGGSGATLCISHGDEDCSECDANYFLSKAPLVTTKSTCLACTNCPAKGRAVGTPCSAVADAICGKCSGSTYDTGTTCIESAHLVLRSLQGENQNDGKLTHTLSHFLVNELWNF